MQMHDTGERLPRREALRRPVAAHAAGNSTAAGRNTEAEDNIPDAVLRRPWTVCEAAIAA